MRVDDVVWSLAGPERGITAQTHKVLFIYLFCFLKWLFSKPRAKGVVMRLLLEKCQARNCTLRIIHKFPLTQVFSLLIIVHHDLQKFLGF